MAQHVTRCAACADYLDAARFQRRFSAVLSKPIDQPGPPTPATAPLALPGYLIQAEISRGGQGVVYRALQTTTQQTVAVKVLHASHTDSPRSRARFAREIEIAAALQHPGIVRVFDSLSLPDGRYALIMELIEGRPLDEWLASSPRPPVRAALVILAQVAEALHHAHQKGVIHRDLKPANVLIDPAGMPHILDFGVARWTDPAQQRTQVTATGEFSGTLAYAAPEQVSEHARGIDLRSDLYAVGVMAYQAVTGSLPYRVDGSLETILFNILQTPPGRPRQSAMDEDLWTILNKALAKEPDRRYQTAAELARDLRQYLAGDAIDARRDSRWYVIRKSVRRNRYPVAAGCIVFAAALVIAGVLGVSNSRLSAALHDSTIARLKTLAATGSRAKAEAILWPEIQATVPTDGDPERFLWTGALRQRMAVWTFLELQGQATCTNIRSSTGNLPTRLTMLDSNRAAMTYQDGSVDLLELPSLRATRLGYRVPLDMLNHSFTTDGRYLVVLRPKSVECRDGESGALLAAVDLPEDPSRFRNISVGNSAVAVSQTGEGLTCYSLPEMKPMFSKSDGLPAQSVWMNDRADRMAYLGLTGELVLVEVPSGRILDRREFLTTEDLTPRINFRIVPQLLLRQDATLAFAGLHHSAHVIDLAGHRPPQALTRGSGYRPRGSMDPSGRYLLSTAFGESRLRIWDSQTSQDLPSLPGHESAAVLHRFTPDGRSILTTDSMGTIRLWAGPGHGWRQALTAPNVNAHDLAITPDGRRLFAAASDGRLSSIDLASTTPDDNPPPGKVIDPRTATTVSYSASLGLLAGAGYAGVLSVAPADGSGPGRTLEIGAEERIHSVRFSPDGRSLALCTLDGRLLRVDPVTMAIAAEASVSGRQLSALRFSPDGRTIAVSTRNGEVALFEAESLKLRRMVELSTRQFRSLEFTPDGREIGAVGDAGELFMTDASGEGPTRSVRISEDTLFALAFHPGGRTVATGDRSGSVVVLDRETLRTLATFDAVGPVMSVMFDPKGQAMFVAALERPIERWDLSGLARTLAAIRPDRVAAR